MSRIVVALGGNALGNTPEEQKEMIEKAAVSLVDLVEMGNELIVTHGNGPQVGMIEKAFDTASKADKTVAKMELPECTAMSQGYIGYHLQQGLGKELGRRGLLQKPVSIVTQVEVSVEDPAFLNPTKPIGSFYTQEEAKKIMEQKPELFFAEDAGRGYRQMVASPRPIKIVEHEAISELPFDKFVIIASGGGGIPVILDESGMYKGVAAVIDKDFSASKLAEMIDADTLFILTAVDRVAINWGKANQEEIAEMTVAQAKEYSAEGHFLPGSMLPKVEAACKFAELGNGKKAVIASLEKASDVILGKTGTVIVG